MTRHADKILLTVTSKSSDQQIDRMKVTDCTVHAREQTVLKSAGNRDVACLAQSDLQYRNITKVS